MGAAIKYTDKVHVKKSKYVSISAHFICIYLWSPWKLQQRYTLHWRCGRRCLRNSSAAHRRRVGVSNRRVFQRPITTICWGHRDSRLFLACGPALYVVRVEHRVASLQLLCQQGIASALREERDVGKLNMPSLLCSYVTTAFIPTIKVRPLLQRHTHTQ